MTDEKILQILRENKDKYVSAREIAEKGALSAGTVIRHIQKLREAGYDIEARPRSGYKLLSLPDKMFSNELKWQLNTKVIGKIILSYNIVDSTNTIARSLAEEGLPEGTAVFAEGQKKGRGRLGRSWVSPKSKGIYFSLILKPEIPVKKLSLLTLMAGVSCCSAIRKVCGLDALIRWPNDILVNNKKVCGILTEMDQQNKFVIMGVGINVNTRKNRLPPQGSSLKEESGKSFSRLELARELLRQIDSEYLDFKHTGKTEFLARWSKLSALLGKRVKVSVSQHKVFEGQAQDIDSSGALIVRMDNGFKQHVVAGDVVKVR